MGRRHRAGLVLGAIALGALAACGSGSAMSPPTEPASPAKLVLTPLPSDTAPPAPPAPGATAPDPTEPAGRDPGTTPTHAFVPDAPVGQEAGRWRSFTMAFTGDVLPHTPIIDRARANAGGHGYDFTPMFADIRPLIESADLAVCHLETPVAPPGEALSTAPRYGVPPDIAPALAATGYDRCSAASNHSLDRGVAGVTATVNALEGAGLGVSGLARTSDEAVEEIFAVNGVELAHLAYTFSFNGLLPPKGQEWLANVIDPFRIVQDARNARARGAEFVFVSLHWGVEKESAIQPTQRRLAEAIMATGAVDLIVGHHAHVLQPIEQVAGHWVVYGLGNVLSNLSGGPGWPESSEDAAVVTVKVDEVAQGRFSVERPVVWPTYVQRGPFNIIDVVHTLANGGGGGLRAVLVASLRRTQQVLGPFIGEA